MDQNKEIMEIDIMRILNALWKKIWILILALCIGAGVGYAYAYYMVAPTYQSDVLLYVNASSISVGGTKVSISNSELNTAKNLLDTYVVILKSRSTLNMVIDEAQLDCSTGQLADMIGAGSVDETEVMRIQVTAGDPEQAEKIANVIAEVLPKRISQIIEGTSVQIVDYAIIPSQRSSPSYTRYAEIAGVVLMLLVAAVIIFIDMLDDRIDDESYLIDNYEVPLLAVIPDLDAPGKGYYKKNKYGYYKKYGYANDYVQAKTEQSALGKHAEGK